LWNIAIPKVCFMSWKKLLNLHELAKEFISFKVGESHSIFLWLDCWHPTGRLLDTYGYRIVYDTGSNLDARVSSVLIDRRWVWPPARSDLIVEIQNRLCDVAIGERDIPVWKTSRRIYSYYETWNCLRTKFTEVAWSHVVWFPLAIPRHAFLLWLVFRGALVTKERMCCWGYEGNTLCRFCYGGQESIDHIFFHCSFCRRIWRNLMALCLVQQSFTEWDDVVSWSCSLKGRSLQVLVCKLCLVVAVYHLQRLRNDLCQGNTPRTEETLVA